MQRKSTAPVVGLDFAIVAPLISAGTMAAHLANMARDGEWQGGRYVTLAASEQKLRIPTTVEEDGVQHISLAEYKVVVSVVREPITPMECKLADDYDAAAKDKQAKRRAEDENSKKVLVTEAKKEAVSTVHDAYSAVARNMASIQASAAQLAKAGIGVTLPGL